MGYEKLKDKQVEKIRREEEAKVINVLEKVDKLEREFEEQKRNFEEVCFIMLVETDILDRLTQIITFRR
jgi:nitric oxide reductase activation protein